jgi:hypothetical protein
VLTLYSKDPEFDYKRCIPGNYTCRVNSHYSDDIVTCVSSGLINVVCTTRRKPVWKHTIVNACTNLCCGVDLQTVGHCNIVSI